MESAERREGEEEREEPEESLAAGKEEGSAQAKAVHRAAEWQQVIPSLSPAATSDVPVL